MSTKKQRLIGLAGGPQQIGEVGEGVQSLWDSRAKGTTSWLISKPYGHEDFQIEDEQGGVRCNWVTGM